VNTNRKGNVIKTVIVVCLVIGMLLIPGIALAHQNVTVGDYVVEYGWFSEPAVVGQPNAVVINLSMSSTTADSSQAIDISGLQIQVVYGGQSKILTLQPLSENAPNQFVAPITPMLPGKYTIHLGGKIGSTDFNTDVQPEEVQTVDVVQFPAAATSQGAASSFGLQGWLGIAGILLGAAGIILGVMALNRKLVVK